jgi:seryl-tRNA synthetase
MPCCLRTRVCLQVIEVDVAWRQSQFKVENLRADYGKVNKEVAMKKKAGENADDLIAKAKEIDTEIKVRSSRGRERGRGRGRLWLPSQYFRYKKLDKQDNVYMY